MFSRVFDYLPTWLGGTSAPVVHAVAAASDVNSAQSSVSSRVADEKAAPSESFEKDAVVVDKESTAAQILADEQQARYFDPVAPQENSFGENGGGLPHVDPDKSVLSPRSSEVALIDTKLVALQRDLQGVIQRFRELDRQVLVTDSLTLPRNVKVSSAEEKALPQQRWSLSTDVNKAIEAQLNSTANTLLSELNDVAARLKDASSAEDFDQVCVDSIKVASQLDCFISSVRENIASAKQHAINNQVLFENLFTLLKALAVKYNPVAGLLLSLLPANKNAEQQSDHAVKQQVQPEVDKVMHLADGYVARLIAVLNHVQGKLELQRQHDTQLRVRIPEAGEDPATPANTRANSPVAKRPGTPGVVLKKVVNKEEKIEVAVSKATVSANSSTLYGSKRRALRFAQQPVVFAAPAPRRGR